MPGPGRPDDGTAPDDELNAVQRRFDPGQQDGSLEGNLYGSIQRGRGTGDLLSDFLDPDVANYVHRQMRGRGLEQGIKDEHRLSSELSSGFNREARQNPYSMDMGNQVREGFSTALSKLHNGTSVVGGQAAQAQGDLQMQVQQAAARRGGLGQSMVSQTGAAGGGDLAARAGQGRNAEFMRQQSAVGEGQGVLRGQDIRQSRAFQQTGLQSRAQDDALRRFYGDTAGELTGAKQDLIGQKAVLEQELRVAKDAQNWEAAKSIATAIGTLVKMIAGGG